MENDVSKVIKEMCEKVLVTEEIIANVLMSITGMHNKAKYLESVYDTKEIIMQEAYE